MISWKKCKFLDQSTILYLCYCFSVTHYTKIYRNTISHFFLLTFDFTSIKNLLTIQKMKIKDDILDSVIEHATEMVIIRLQINGMEEEKTQYFESFSAWHFYWWHLVNYAIADINNYLIGTVIKTTDSENTFYTLNRSISLKIQHKNIWFPINSFT